MIVHGLVRVTIDVDPDCIGNRRLDRIFVDALNAGDFLAVESADLAAPLEVEVDDRHDAHDHYGSHVDDIIDLEKERIFHENQQA